jgi:hypothetical protein
LDRFSRDELLELVAPPGVRGWTRIPSLKQRLAAACKGFGLTVASFLENAKSADKLTTATAGVLT